MPRAGLEDCLPRGSGETHLEQADAVPWPNPTLAYPPEKANCSLPRSLDVCTKRIVSGPKRQIVLVVPTSDEDSHNRWNSWSPGRIPLNRSVILKALPRRSA